MSVFEWLGDRAILYKGRVCPLTEHDGWEVCNAMRRVDEEEARERKRLKEEIKAELDGAIMGSLAKRKDNAEERDL